MELFDPANGFTAIRNETLRNMNFTRIHKRYFFETSILIELYHADAVVQDYSDEGKIWR